ncbi:MAG: hypothetical protein K2M47_07050 [Clostridiales bacterium]|nr:hypothetical protein [Clostridiales bacterium]
MIGHAATNNRNLRYTKIALLGFFLIWLAMSLFSYNVHAEVLPYSLESECYALSKTDILEGTQNDDGVPYTIYDYIDAVKSKKGAIFTNAELNTQLLYKIIPERLLNDTCSYFHRGATYSFYVKTTANTKDYPYASEVVIIPHKLELSRGTDVSLELSVFTQGYYSKKSSTTGKNISYCNSFTPAEYYLRDFQFFCGTKNIDAPNYGDANYSKVNDVGPILRQISIDFKAVKNYKSNKTIEPLLSFGMDVVFSYMPGLSQYNKLYRGLKTLAKWIEAWDYCRDDPDIQYDIKSSKINVTGFDGRGLQLKNDKPYLEHFATVAPVYNSLLPKYPMIGFDGSMKCTMMVDIDTIATKASISAMYNLFMHYQNGKDYIIMPSGTNKAYTTDCSKTAQMTCGYDIVIND